MLKFRVVDVKELASAIPSAVDEEGNPRLDAIQHCIDNGVRWMPGVEIYYEEAE